MLNKENAILKFEEMPRLAYFTPWRRIQFHILLLYGKEEKLPMASFYQSRVKEKVNGEEYAMNQFGTAISSITKSQRHLRKGASR